MFISHLLAIAASVSFVSAVYQGFNYGSVFTDNSPIGESDYQKDFSTAQNLVGTSGFTSARLYTMIQGGTTNTPTEAIPAAISTKTTLLLGLWASAGQSIMNNEVAALTAAISQYGTSFTDLIAGIVVGSEDLYRISPIGIQKKAGIGAEPADIINYISQVRSAIANTAASSALVGHVDTYTVWLNGSNSAVINACDFIGMDSYPYFEDTVANSIDAGYDVFFQTLNSTEGVSKGKPVWVTETGWPVSGPTDNLAVASIQNAQTYWEKVGCALFGKTNTWWYTLQDADPTTPTPSFGIVGSQLSTTPLFNLTCPVVPSNQPSSTHSSNTHSTSPPTSSGSPVSNTPAGASATSVTSPNVASSSPAGTKLTSF
jgi:glucan endo-1,3-beta-D-glucosidase